jgi:hypothetical protein
MLLVRSSHDVGAVPGDQRFPNRTTAATYLSLAPGSAPCGCGHADRRLQGACKRRQVAARAYANHAVQRQLRREQPRAALVIRWSAPRVRFWSRRRATVRSRVPQRRRSSSDECRPRSTRGARIHAIARDRFVGCALPPGAFVPMHSMRSAKRVALLLVVHIASLLGCDRDNRFVMPKQQRPRVPSSRARVPLSTSQDCGRGPRGVVLWHLGRACSVARTELTPAGWPKAVTSA